MIGIKKYFVKLFILYIVLTNTMPPAVLASQISTGALNQPMMQQSTDQDKNTSDSQSSDSSEQTFGDTQVSPPNEPITALPITAHKFTAAASILGLATTGNPQTSATKRLGVHVGKLFKHDFKADENITLNIDNPDQESYKTKITDAAGNPAPVAIQHNNLDGTTQLQVIPTNQFKPGKYTLRVTDATGTTTQQDFTWGVLALNPDKVVYAPQETANFSMAVLDDKGSMVCDAGVTLTITNAATNITDTLSTDNKQITINPECSSHSFTLKPDYEAHYQLGGVGVYDLTLTARTPNGTHTITDQINVQETTPFVVQRTSATRIYPPNTYPMQINVTAQQNFNGTITETVPASFAITPASSSASYDAMKTVYLENNKDPSQNLAHTFITSASGLVMPFDGNYPITQGFGSQLTDPTLQALYTKFGLAGHDGIDFGVPMGTPLYAVDDGTIAWAGPGDYGTQVIIKHAWGQTYYGHMSKTSVNVGDEVKKGTLLGYSGMSGEATGPHLHFGMKPTNPDMNNGYSGKIDPLPYLPIGNTAKGINLPRLVGLPDVLGASTSANASASGTNTIPTPTVIASPTGAAISNPLSATPRTDTIPPASSSAQFTIEDAASQESADNQPQSLEKVKVLKWHVNLKKGDNISLSYNFKTPLVSPQFYLIGSLKFFTITKTGQINEIFDEGRQWQIAADDMGTGWYHNSTSAYNGYEWPYRKKLTVDHTQVGATYSMPTFDPTVGATNTTNTSAGVNTLNLNVNVTSNNNRLLIAETQANKTVSSITDTTTSGSFTKISSVVFDATDNVTSEMWYMIAPASGTNNIKVNLTATSAHITLGVGSYYNVNQTTPLGTQNTTTGNSLAPSVTVTTNTSQLVVDGVNNYSGQTLTKGSGQTQAWQNTVWGGVASSYASGGASTTTMSWSMPSSSPNEWADIAVPVNGVTTQPNSASNLPQFDISNTTSKTAVSTAPVNLVVGNNSNRMLMVAVNDNKTVTGITANNTSGNQSFTKINNIKFDAANSVSLELWYLLNPATGTNNVTVTLNASSPGLTVGVSSYYNVNQTTPLGTQNTTNNTSTAPSATVSSTTSQLVVDAVTNKNGGTFTVGGGQTQEFQKVPGGGIGAIASSDEVGGASTTIMSWTQTSDLWGQIAVPVNGVDPPTGETNFPVLVSLTDTDLKNHAQNDGDDILFTDATGQTKIPSELEHYDNTTGELEAWVQISNLSFSTDTNIYMYYGNGSVGSQSTPNSVWDSNYKNVLHSGESGTTLNDSTSNGFNGTATRSNSVTGQIANGHSYVRGSSDYVNISSVASSINTGNFSYSAWVKKPSSWGPGAGGADEEVFGLLDNTTNDSTEMFFRSDTGVLEFNRDNGTSLLTADTSQTSWAANTWYYVTATFDTSAGMVLYVNGVSVATNTNTARTGTVHSTKFLVGAYFFSSTTNGYFNGTIDEARVSNTTRSSDWIATEYANQNSPATFFKTPGSEETKIYAAPLSALMRHGKFFDTSSNNYGEQPFLF